MKLLRPPPLSFFPPFFSFLILAPQSGYERRKKKGKTSEKFYSISARFIIWCVTIRYRLEWSVKRVTDHHTLEWTAIPWRNFV